MSDAKRKVLDMVEQGKITGAEGDALLAAMRPRRISARLLIDPYERIPLPIGIAIGAAAAAASAFAAVRLGVRFDGYLDLHVAPGAVGAATAIADQVVAWPLSALALWLVALAFTRSARLVDFLAAVGIARLLPLVAGLLLAPLTPPPAALAAIPQHAVQDPAAALADLVPLLPMIAVALVFVVWFVTTAVFGFRHASGLRRGRLAGAAVAAILAAEIVSKIALFGLGALLG